MIPGDHQTTSTGDEAVSGKLDYWRADNMWAAKGRPDGNLGMESITLEQGQKRVFSTDWKYEKQRNDGTNYYGSHGRRLKNSGGQVMDVKLTSQADILPDVLRAMVAGAPPGYVRLKPDQTVDIKADIQEVSCPKV
jgi:hypothetical protein